MTEGSRRRAAIVALLGLVALASPGGAQEVSLPPDLQVGLLSKILTFDRKIERYGPELVLGVAFLPRNRESVRARDELLRSVEGAGAIRVDGLPLRVVDVPVHGEHLPGGLAQVVDVLYVTPMRGVDASALFEEASALGMLTVTATPGEASGAAVSLLLLDTRPHIRIDLRAARLAGADLSSRLLRVAEVRE